jgi:hypothetical protein
MDEDKKAGAEGDAEKKGDEAAAAVAIQKPSKAGWKEYAITAAVFVLLLWYLDAAGIAWSLMSEYLQDYLPDDQPFIIPADRFSIVLPANETTMTADGRLQAVLFNSADDNATVDSVALTTLERKKCKITTALPVTLKSQERMNLSAENCAKTGASAGQSFMVIVQIGGATTQRAVVATRAGWGTKGKEDQKPQGPGSAAAQPIDYLSFGTLKGVYS